MTFSTTNQHQAILEAYKYFVQKKKKLRNIYIAIVLGVYTLSLILVL